jgi:hypothetical protein
MYRCQIFPAESLPYWHFPHDNTSRAVGNSGH